MQQHTSDQKLANACRRLAFWARRAAELQRDIPPNTESLAQPAQSSALPELDKNTAIANSSDENITLRAVTKLRQLRRNGRKPSLAAVYRWTTSGVRGVVLESFIVGGSRCTTSAAVDRWIAALTAKANGESQPSRTPLSRKREHDRAEKALERDGW